MLNKSSEIAKMDDSYFIDEYDYYNFGNDYAKITNSSGKAESSHAKGKAKKINQKFTPSGNVRSVVTKLQNAEKKEKQARQRTNSV